MKQEKLEISQGKQYPQGCSSSNIHHQWQKEIDSLAVILKNIDILLITDVKVDHMVLKAVSFKCL